MAAYSNFGAVEAGFLSSLTSVFTFELVEAAALFFGAAATGVFFAFGLTSISSSSS